jgi:hypothetical protein
MRCVSTLYYCFSSIHRQCFNDTNMPFISHIIVWRFERRMDCEILHAVVPA